MPAYFNARKAERDDRVRNALANLCEDLDGAQGLLVEGQRDLALPEANEAVTRFVAVANHGIRDIKMTMNGLGRIELYCDYADRLGEFQITYTARYRGA